jgi:CPA1 family monovalent cation:H+ antiporter
MRAIDFPMLGLILFVACLVATITRRLKLPYSAGLVAAGLALALLPIGFEVRLTPEMIFTLFLPPLIFEAAIQIPWAALRRELPLLGVLVTIGVLLAAAVVAAGMHWLIGWSWLGSAFFAILVAATDPVSVIAMFKEVPVEPRLHLLVEAESLLNDGVAAVVFAVLVVIAGGSAVTVPAIGLKLLTTSLGGLAAGAAVSLPLLLIAGRTSDRLVEITLTTLAAFGSFLLAENFHASGVLAGLTAGLIVGNFGWKGAISDASRPNVLYFWDYAAFLANSFIFILIGGAEAGTPIVPVLAAASVAIVLAMLGRAATIYPVALAFRRTSLAIAAPYQHVLWWGGLRGALALGLALAVPASVPEREQIIPVAFAIVAFSVFVQGLTMAPLVRRLKLLREEHG